MEDILYHAQISKDLEPAFKKIRIRDLDLKKYYAEFPEYQTSHILLRLRANPSETEKMEALKSILNIHKDIKKTPRSLKNWQKSILKARPLLREEALGSSRPSNMLPNIFGPSRERRRGTSPLPSEASLDITSLKFSALKISKTSIRPSTKKSSTTGKEIV